MGEHPVDFVRLGKHSLFRLSDFRAGKFFGYVFVSFVGYHRFEVLAEGRFFENFFRALARKLDFVVFQKLNRVKKGRSNFFRTIIRARAFYLLLKRALQNGFALSLFRHGSGPFHKLFYTLFLQRGNFRHGHAERFFKRFRVNLVARLFHLVHHIQCDYDGNVRFEKLGG